MKILVIDVVGFIGMYTAKSLLEDGHDVVGLDNLNEYYDVRLKYWRLDQIKPFLNFRFVKMDLADRVECLLKSMLDGLWLYQH